MKTIVDIKIEDIKEVENTEEAKFWYFKFDIKERLIKIKMSKKKFKDKKLAQIQAKKEAVKVVEKINYDNTAEAKEAVKEKEIEDMAERSNNLTDTELDDLILKLQEMKNARN